MSKRDAQLGQQHQVLLRLKAPSLKKLQLKVTDKRRLKIASEEIVEYQVSEACIQIEGKGYTRLCLYTPQHKTLKIYYYNINN